MRYYIITSLTLFSLLLSCKEVANLLDPGNPPEIEKIKVDREIVYPGDTVMATIVAINPGDGPLSYSWWSEGGGNTVQPADNDTAYWVAPYPGGKTCIIRVKVSNGNGDAEDSKAISVRSLEKPLIIITKPEKNELFLLHQTFMVQASAVHPDGIKWVKVYLVGTFTEILIDSMGYRQSGVYAFSVEATEDMIGQKEFRVKAMADNDKNLIGSDQIKIQVEGVITGGAQQN